MSARESHLDELARVLRAELVERRRAEAVAGRRVDRSVEETVSELVRSRAAVLPEGDREELEARVKRDAVGFGPLEKLFEDPEVEEVMVNGPGNVYVERTGAIERSAAWFADEEELRNAIERILATTGRRVDELSPMVDARLADGSRVNVVIPPLAVDGPTVSIRRFRAERPGPERLLELDTLDEPALGRLRSAVTGRSNVLISGGTGAGKTTLLGALSSFIDAAERIITIEDAAELSLRQPHVVRLESRPASVEGRGEVSIRDLLRNALRMRPDRIVIGEVRGPEAFDLMMALNTGHRGTLSTVHANSPADALRRLESLVLMADTGLPHSEIREQLRRGFDLVVQMVRAGGGVRRVEEIVGVASIETESEDRPERDLGL